MHLQLVSVTLSTSRRRQLEWYALDVQFTLWEGFIVCNLLLDEPLVQGSRMRLCYDAVVTTSRECLGF